MRQSIRKQKASLGDLSAIEKGSETPAGSEATGSSSLGAKYTAPQSILGRWNAKIEGLAGIEARGITRVEPHERQPETFSGYVQIALLWFSVDVTANNLALGLLGPLAYGLSFLDAALCAVFGGMLGSLGVAYMATWGPRSGNRTMVVARYFLGYYPSKLACLLNVVIMLGYGMIDCIIGGQILSAVSGGSMSIIVGIVIVAVVTWVVAVCGIGVFHLYMRWAWLPQIIALFVLVGSAGPKFDTSLSSTGNPETINANRLSFFSLCVSAPIAWAPSAADYFVYYPETSKRWKAFLASFTGLTLAISFVYLMGVGLGSATFSQPAWDDAYGVSSGALIVAGFTGLGGFGKFCSVLIALGVIANNIPGTYSAALGIQVLGRYAKVVPRYIWVTVSAIIYFVCAVAGRNNLFDIFENWLALMGYWVVSFLVIVLLEDLIFRRGKGYDWRAWEDRSRLPIGYAGLTAFLAGWAGAIVSMDQIYYVGPLAKMVGEDGADMGLYLAAGFTLVVFPPLRWLEMRFVGR